MFSAPILLRLLLSAEPEELSLISRGTFESGQHESGPELTGGERKRTAVRARSKAYRNRIVS